MKITIEGNIGCGKSSVMRKVHETTRLPIFLEPVDEWADWLNMFYNDPKRWGFTFNVNVLLTFNRWKNVECTALYERSPMSCREVFTTLQYNNKDISQIELELFDNLYTHLNWKPNVIIYLRVDPHICMDRMNKRGRICENKVSLVYLQAIHEQYEKMIQKAEAEGIQIIVIDASQNADEVYNNVMEVVSKLRNK
jgi:deoxyadenosine/deoxycytidine kinase